MVLNPVFCESVRSERSGIRLILGSFSIQADQEAGRLCVAQEIRPEPTGVVAVSAMTAVYTPSIHKATAIWVGDFFAQSL
jgi:hypothetical protein